MLKSFLALFEQAQQQPSTHTIELATAALLSEVIRADNAIDSQEVISLKQQLSRHFSLSEEVLNTLVSDGQSQAEHAVDLVQFTSVVNENFSAEQRVSVITSMWKIAAADGNIDKYEEHIIRKIADLLYIPHSQYIRAKLSVIDSSQ